MKYILSILLVLAMATAVRAQVPTPVPTATITINPYVPNGFLGFITTTITPSVALPPGQPTWQPIALPDDGSQFATVNFTVPAGVAAPTTYQMLVNGVCVKDGNGNCTLPAVPVHFVCTSPGYFNIRFAATNFLGVPATVVCLPPSQVPSTTPIVPGTGQGAQ